MKNRFKFRVWDKENFNYLEFEGFKKGKIEFNFDIDTNSIWIEFDHNKYILEQSTGLKDKNGKLIYEGDILKGKKNMICSPHSSRMIDKVGVVEIPQYMFVATCRDVKNNCTLFCQNDWVKTEVIGNIYENSELLGVKNE